MSTILPIQSLVLDVALNIVSITISEGKIYKIFPSSNLLIINGIFIQDIHFNNVDIAIIIVSCVLAFLANNQNLKCLSVKS